MLHSGRDEFSTGASHIAKELLSRLIDERDLFEINDCAGPGRSGACVIPARTQFIHPGAGQAPMQAPMLPVGGIGIADSKHAATPFAFGKRHPLCRSLQRSFSTAFAKSEAEIAAGPSAWDRDFGKCRELPRCYPIRYPRQAVPKVLPILRHLPLARHKKQYRERRKPWIFSRFESAAEMLSGSGKV